MIYVSEIELSEILAILSKHVQNGYVVAFGSRYKGTPKPYSDLDLAIAKHDKSRFTWKEIADLKESFEESELNFRVDVVDYWSVGDNFRAIIDSGCCRIYENFKD